MVAILVVLTILVCVTIDAFMQWSTARRQQVLLAGAVSGARPLQAFHMDQISVPGGVYMDPAHTWVSVNPDGKAWVGVDDFLLKAVGRIDGITMPALGEETHRGETLFTIRQGDRTLEIPSPVDGVINTVNPVLDKNAEPLEASPYERGWICGITPDHLAKNLRSLSIAEEATEWIRSEVKRFQDFIVARPMDQSVGLAMPDGGVPVTGILEHLDNETWNRFAFEFVRVHAHES